MILSTNLVFIISLLFWLLLLFLLLILLKFAHYLVQLTIAYHGYLRAMNLKRLGTVLWFAH